MSASHPKATESLRSSEMTLGVISRRQVGARSTFKHVWWANILSLTGALVEGRYAHQSALDNLVYLPRRYLCGMGAGFQGDASRHRFAMAHSRAVRRRDARGGK